MSYYAKNVEDLKPYEVQVLVDFFTFYMTSDLRHKLMHEFPKIYNALYSSKIMKSEVSLDDIFKEEESK